MFSKKERDTLITILLLAAYIDELDENKKGVDWFGKKQFSWLKQAKTLIIKSFQEGIATKFNLKESKKFHNQIVNSSFEIKNNQNHIDSLCLPTQVVYTLAERAISDSCKGCTITKYRRCELFQSLEMAEIPSACDEKGVCPYRQ